MLRNHLLAIGRAAGVILLAGWLGGCTLNENVGTPASVEQRVQIAQYEFSPATLRVSVGTTVIWINRDDIGHTVTSISPDGVLNSDGLVIGQMFSYTFDTPGTYHYHCSIHPAMRGTVIVQ